MGSCAELCVARYGFTREQQDAHAEESHARARRAVAQGWTQKEIVGVQVRCRNGSGEAEEVGLHAHLSTSATARGQLAYHSAMCLYSSTVVCRVPSMTSAFRSRLPC
jgi:acetyl-CoA acetyltransferase